MTLLHAECFAELARCPTLGCASSRQRRESVEDGARHRSSWPLIVAFVAVAHLVVLAALSLARFTHCRVSAAPDVQADHLASFQVARAGALFDLARYHVRSIEADDVAPAVHCMPAIALLEDAHRWLAESRALRINEGSRQARDLDQLDQCVRLLRVTCNKIRLELGVTILADEDWRGR